MSVQMNGKKRSRQYSLILLAGGKSSRMGTNKAELLIEGESFLSCLLRKTEKLGIREKYISCYVGVEKSRKGFYMISDIYENRGPLGGIHACMKAMNTPYCLVLPVDVPQIPESVLEELILCHERRTESDSSETSDRPLLLSHGKRTEPLIGIYPVRMANMIGEMIKDGSASVFRVLDKWGYDTCRISVEEWQTQNINTPEDYRELLTHMEKRNDK